VVEQILDWAGPVFNGALVLVVITGLLKLGYMHGDAIRWLKTIATNLDNHIVRNAKAHDDIHDDVKDITGRIDRVDTKVELLCDKEDKK
jgi:hypothetical protein